MRQGLLLHRGGNCASIGCAQCLPACYMHAKRALLKCVKSPMVPERDLLTLCGACFEGQNQARVPADTACTYCVAGKYSENHIAYRCLDCPAGKSSRATGEPRLAASVRRATTMALPAAAAWCFLSRSRARACSLSRSLPPPLCRSLARSSRAHAFTFSSACAGVSERGVWDGGDGLHAVRGRHEGAWRGQLDHLRGVRGGELPGHGLWMSWTTIQQVVTSTSRVKPSIVNKRQRLLISTQQLSTVATRDACFPCLPGKIFTGAGAASACCNDCAAGTYAPRARRNSYQSLRRC